MCPIAPYSQHMRCSQIMSGSIRKCAVRVAMQCCISGTVSRKEPKGAKVLVAIACMGENARLCHWIRRSVAHRFTINPYLVSPPASQQCRHELFTMSLGNAHAIHRDFHKIIIIFLFFFFFLLLLLLRFLHHDHDHGHHHHHHHHHLHLHKSIMFNHFQSF